jgi:cytochrome c biogenesis protein CcmG/thiol:disulfide interchange protein DsbE
MKIATRLVLALVLLALGIYLGIRRHREHLGKAEIQVSAEMRQLTPAPDFTLTALDGQPLRLADYKGKVVLLDFWATWCAPCRSEIPKFVTWQKQYGPQGLQVIGISMDDSDKPVPGFVQQFQIDYPVALGDAKLADQYGGVLGLPVTFVIDRDGRIHHKHVGLTDTALLEGEIKRLLEK